MGKVVVTFKEPVYLADGNPTKAVSVAWENITDPMQDPITGRWIQAVGALLVETQNIISAIYAETPPSNIPQL